MQNKHSSELKELLTNVEAALIQAGQNARKLAEQTGTKLIIVEKVPTSAQSTQGNASITENTGRPNFSADLSNLTTNYVEDFEKQKIQSLMIKYLGNKTAVAKELGVSRRTLYARLSKYTL